jgi:iron complex transport system permease protein
MTAFWAGLLVFVLGSLALGLMLGRGSLDNEALKSTLLTMRAQRVAVAFLAGGALAAGGVIAQALFRNPLADPSVLGTSAGASLGGQLVLLGTALLFRGRAPAEIAPEMLIPLGCIAGAGVSLAIVLSVSARRTNPVSLILTGFVLTSLFVSASTLLISASQESWQLVRALNTFMSGSVSGSGPRQVGIACLLVIGGTLPALLWWRSFDLLLSGEEEALSLGVDVPRVRFWAVVWAATLTAGAVAVGASVGFVGLIVPHAARMFVGHGHRRLLPAAFLSGGGFLVLCDLLTRIVPFNGEISLGAITGLIGAPLFLWMLRDLERERNHV